MVVHTWAITSASRPSYKSLVCIVRVSVAVLIKHSRLVITQPESVRLGLFFGPKLRDITANTGLKCQRMSYSRKDVAKRYGSSSVKIMRVVLCPVHQLKVIVKRRRGTNPRKNVENAHGTEGRTRIPHRYDNNEKGI